MILLAASLFFTNPAPLDMPRAEAYLVQEDSRMRLEDRYNRQDLWTSRAVRGRWLDDDGRTFTLSTLAYAPPAIAADATITRRAYADERVPITRKTPKLLRQAIAALSPCALAEKPKPPRQMPRGYADVDYWQGTNQAAIVCAFRPAHTSVWFLAVWELVETDVFDECKELFEEHFLEKEFASFNEKNPETPCQTKNEREALRADARHSVEAYDNWHVTDSDEFVVLDDLLASGAFRTVLTNDLKMMRAQYAAALPTHIDGSNVLAVARIYANRDEYLDALTTDDATNMVWSAAYWSPRRRELVAHLSEKGAGELLRTIRHEAFHQYLSYATAMIPTSPWLNEGYAQYFEDTSSAAWGRGLNVTDENIDKLAALLPPLFMMDYETFYGGSDNERMLKYHLAWSVAIFLEKGIQNIRFEPFKTFKADYIKALFRTQDMQKATECAFASRDNLNLFINEWKRYWKNTPADFVNK